MYDFEKAQAARITLGGILDENETLRAQLSDALYQLEKERFFIRLELLPDDDDEADSMLDQTMVFDEHPDWYGDACACQLCRSYGD